MPQPQHQQSQRMYAQPIVLDEYRAPSFWIRYKPERVSPRLRHLLTALAGALISTALAWFLTRQNDDLVPMVLGYISICLAAYFIVLLLSPLRKLALLFSPNHIEISEKGIRFHWMRLFFQGCTPLVGWDRISHVTTRAEKVGDREEVTLEFNAITRGFSVKDRLQYFMLAPALTWGWFSSDRAQIHLNIDAIASSDDRKRLQTGLKKFLPSYRIDPKVADDLNIFIKFDSYTDLWLDKLQETGSRNKETALAPGTVLCNGGYEVVEQIGSGGQAVVYRAIMRKAISETANLGSGRRTVTRVDFSDLPIAVDNGDGAPHTVVLKEFVLPIQAGLNVRKRVLENIQKEARLWHKLRHPNIARLVDFFIEDQRAYLVLEHIEGTNVKRLVTTNGAMSEAKAIDLSIQMCDILGYLHRRQPPVVHRDFTPDNLILDTSGKVKLIDLNVALQLEAQTTKTVVGKHSYIPPEQFRGKAVPQSDLYALGASLYFILVGKDPEPITQAHPRAQQPALSEEIDQIVSKATSLSLATRYQDCHELKKDLVRLVEMHPKETSEV